MSEQYWGSIPDSVKYAKGSGYKQYLRTKSWVESRIGSDGTMNAYVNAMRNANSVKSSTNSWEYTGPYEIPGGTQARYQSSKGWIWSCQVNPVNHNEIYIGAHHGGVWKTTDGGVNWYPLCDEYPLIGGIISLAIDWDAGLNGEDIIYAASTASDDTYWGYSTGVFKSVDGGSSWSDINNGDLASASGEFYKKNIRLLHYKPSVMNGGLSVRIPAKAVFKFMISVGQKKPMDVSQTADKIVSSLYIPKVENVTNIYENALLVRSDGYKLEVDI